MKLEKMPSRLESREAACLDGSEPVMASEPCGVIVSSFFGKLEMGVHRSCSTEKKLSWLRSQVIGSNVEFESPFGRRKLTYADNTASGRCLKYLEDYLIDNLLPYYGNTHTCDCYVGQRTTKTAHEAAEYIKRCLGGTDQDALLFCGSGTTAAIKRLQEVMGIAVPPLYRDRVIGCLGEKERWVVFVGPYEHHSDLLSWRQSLAEVVEIGLDEDGLLDLEALRFQLERRKADNRPLLGSFSACSNVTGICSETRKIARLIHQYGGFVCFDFAASGPYVTIDMRSGEPDGFDAIFLGPHKFLGGPGSPGILLMSKALYKLRDYPPSTCGGGTVDYVNGFDEKLTLYMNDVEARENAGTPPIIQSVRAAMALQVKEFIGYEAIERQERIYVQRALERLSSTPNIRILGNTTAKRQAIVSFLILSTSNPDVSDGSDEEQSPYTWKETSAQDKPLHGPFVATLLNDLFGVQSRGGCACAGPYGHHLLGIDETRSLTLRSAIKKGYVGVKPGWARVSFPYYMSGEELEFILACIEFLAAYGKRFLPLYDFDFRTGNWAFKKNEFHLLPTEVAMQMMNTDEGKCDASFVVEKFAMYIRKAREIADLLPRSPPRRWIPDDIDPEILLFRV